MSLPGPSSGIKWKDYRITTPTFSLTPVEKPDFSPFLIHMTGKRSLVKILKGENIPDGTEIPLNSGYLKSSIPAFDSAQGYYNAKVVCFTESPIFALDFFRYRSFSRWSANQQYGIGFSKSDLIKNQNVRPVVYLDSTSNSQILSLCNKAIKEETKFSDDPIENNQIKNVLKKLKPLLFPLLEEDRLQGFMWEREWRYPFENGFTFPYSSIRVICCPKEERKDIEEILGGFLQNVEVIESWKEYDEVTSYLKRRKTEVNSSALENIESIRDLSMLRNLKEQNEQTKNSLESYYSVFKDTVTNIEGHNINDILSSMKEKSNKIEAQIKRISDEIKVKEEQARLDKQKGKQ